MLFEAWERYVFLSPLPAVCDKISFLQARLASTLQLSHFSFPSSGTPGMSHPCQLGERLSFDVHGPLEDLSCLPSGTQFR